MNNGNGAKNGKRAMAKRPARQRGRPARSGNGRPRQSARVTQPLRSAAIMNINANYRPVRNATQSMAGSDFLSIVEVKAAPTPVQRILSSLDISPSMFPGTRLTQLSQLYERYRFTSFKLRYVPAVPTSIACQLLVYLDTDPSDDPSSSPTAETLIRQASSHTGSQQWNFNVPKVIPLPMRADKQLYYTGDTKLNPRFSLQARAYVIQVTDPVNFNGEPINTSLQSGSLYIDWVCQFQTPQINPAGFLAGDAEATLLAVANPTLAGVPLYANALKEEAPITFKPNSQYAVWASFTGLNRVNSSTVFGGSGSATLQYTFVPKNGGQAPPDASTKSTLSVTINQSDKSIFPSSIPVTTFTTDSAGKVDWVVSASAISTVGVTSGGGFVLQFTRIG